jgi:hypothetical protein
MCCRGANWERNPYYVAVSVSTINTLSSGVKSSTSISISTSILFNRGWDGIKTHSSPTTNLT